MQITSKKDNIVFSKRIEEINHFLFGEYADGKLINHIYMAACLIAFSAAIAGLIFNVIINLSDYFNLTIAFIAVSYAMFYYFAQFKNLYFKNAFVLISQFGLALSWYSEGGLSGPVLPLFIIAIIVFTAISDVKYHLLYLALSIANILLLFFLEKSHFGSYIIQYPDKLSHDLDITYTLIIAVISIFLFAKFIKNAFFREQEIILSQKKELEQFNATKDKFFSIIAHDLRGPFSGIMGLSKIMADDSIDMTKEELQDLASKLSSSASSTYGLLENLLNWAKMKQGHIPYNPKNIHLKSFASKYLEVMQDIANVKNIKTANRIPDDIEVYADEYMLQTIIRNFILNAIKFTQVGGEVVIDATKKIASVVEISIIDNGIGMDQKTMDSIFSIGNQVRRRGTENEPSSGLGILLCKEFIDQHQGEISIKSKPGQGSTFSFTMAQAN